MPKIKSIRRLEQAPIVKAWVEGKTFEEIGKEMFNGASRQLVKQKFDKEAETIYRTQGFKEWISEVAHKEDGTLWEYITFKGADHARFYAWMLRRDFKYHIVDGVHASLEKETIQGVRAKVIKSVHEKGLPLSFDPMPRGVFGFSDLDRFGMFDSFKEHFVTKGNAWDGGRIVALRGEGMIYNLCLWINKEKEDCPTASDTEIVEGAFKSFDKAYKEDQGMETLKKLRAYLEERRNYLYAQKEPCASCLKAYIGIGTRSRGRKKSKVAKAEK